MFFKKFFAGRKKVICSILVIYLFSLVLNFFTKICEDDYSYSFSMVDGSRITGIGQIFSSLYFHAFHLNGRLFAHFWTFFFLMLPKVIFNFVNAGMFCLLIYLICWIIGKHKDAKFYWLIFGMLWVSTPAFGQVFLWLDGSCNYSWGMILGLLFLIIPIRLYRGDQFRMGKLSEAGLLLLAFIMGGYNENISFICIIMACLLAGITFRNKGKLPKFLYLYIMMAFIGWIMLLLMPAEQNKVSQNITFWALYSNLISTIRMVVKECWFLICFWTTLFLLMIWKRINQKAFLMPFVFLIGAIISNEMYIMASYYEGRSMICTAIFLIISCGFMFNSLLTEQDNKKVILILSSIIVVAAGIMLGTGIIDIASCYSQIEDRISYIETEKEKGNYDLVLDQIVCNTKYPGCAGLKKLNTQDPTAWQNGQIEQYFGLKSVLGKETVNQ